MLVLRNARCALTGNIRVVFFKLPVQPLQLEYRLQSPGCSSCFVKARKPAMTSPSAFCNRLRSLSFSYRPKKDVVIKSKPVSYRESNTAVKKSGRTVVIVAKRPCEKTLSSKPKLTGSLPCVKFCSDMTVVKTGNKRNKLATYNKKSAPDCEVHTDLTDISIRSIKQRVPKLVLSRNYPLQIKKRTNLRNRATSDTDVSSDKLLFDPFSKASSCAINRRHSSSSKCGSWQKNVSSKERLTKKENSGRVIINGMNVSRVGAVKCLLLSKSSAWKDRSRLIRLLRKHGKWKHRPSPMSSLTGQGSSVTSGATNLTSVATEMIVTCETGNMVTSDERKDVVSSSCNGDVLMVNNDDVVSSSTSSQPLADNDYDNDDDERVTSADTQTPDNVVCASTTNEVRLLNGTADTDLDEVTRSKCDEKDKTTLCVPIRLGEHGKLLLRLPQNVSVECSFRPVTAAPVTPVASSAPDCLVAESLLATRKPCKPLGCASQLKTLRQAETKQSGGTHLQSNFDCLETTMPEQVDVTSFSEIGISEASGVSLASLPFATVSDECCATTSSNSDTLLINDQPDISLFPFVTVSPSRRKVAPTDNALLPGVVSRVDLTSPLPVVSSSLISPVERPRSSRSDVSSPSQSIIQSENTVLTCTDQLQRDLEIDKVANIRREVIKVPVYTSLFRDSKNESKHLKNATCVISSAGVLDLTVSPTVKQETTSHVKLTKTVEETVVCERKCYSSKRLSDDEIKLLPVFRKTSAADVVGKFPSSHEHGEDVSGSCKKSSSSIQTSGGSASSSGVKTVPSLCVSLERCDAIGRQYTDVNSVTPPTTRRLKLMCNGITIYRTLEDSLCKARINKRRRSSSRSKSFELSSFKPHAAAGDTKNRRKSMLDEDLTPASEMAAERRIVCLSTREDSEDFHCTEQLSVDNAVMNEPLELTTQRVRERYKEQECEQCTTALDLSVNAVV